MGHDRPATARSTSPKALLFAVALASVAATLACRPGGAPGTGSAPPRPPEKPSFAPIPTPATARTERDEAPALSAWARRNLAEAYERVGLRSPIWDGAAREYIAAELPPVMGQRAAQPPAARLELGRRALQLGCRDPVVLFLAGRHLWAEDLDAAESIDLLQRAVAGFGRVPYPRGVARLAASTLLSAYETAQSDEGQQATTLERRWFEEALGDGSYTTEESEVLVWQMSSADPCFSRLRDAALAAMRRGPVAEWARLYFSGWAHVDRAWEARGRGYADAVPESAWPIFRAESEAARRDLVRAWTLRPDRPEAATYMVGVSLDAPVPGETPRLWFERAVSARFDYWPAYERLYYRLLPQWGGSHDEMIGLGLAAAATRRYDTRVPKFLLWVVDWTMADQLQQARRGRSPTRYVTSRPDVQAAMQQVLDGYLSEPEPPEAREVWESLHAIVAERAARFREAREHLSRIGFRLHPHVLWRVRRAADRIETRSAALGGPAAATIAQAEQAQASGGLGASLPLFQQALAEDGEPATQKWVFDRIATLEREQRLAAGEWASLQPRQALLEGWGPREGIPRLDSDGALSLTSGWRGTWLAAAVRLGTDFEVATRIDFAASTNGVHQAGLLFGDPDLDPDDWASVRLRWRGRGIGRVEVGRDRRGKTPSQSARLSLGSSNDVLVRCQGRHVTVTVNGAVALRDVPLEPELRLPSTTAFGLGAGIDDNRTEVRYRDLKARRLEARAVP